MPGAAAAPVRGIGALSSAADAKGPLAFQPRRATTGPSRQARPASRRSLSYRARVSAPSEGQRQQAPGQQDGDPARPIGSRRGRRTAPAPTPAPASAQTESNPGGFQATGHSPLAPEAEVHVPAAAPTPSTQASASASTSASDSSSATASPPFHNSAPRAESCEGGALPLPLEEESSPRSQQHSAEALLSVAAPETADTPMALEPLPGQGAPAAGMPAAAKQWGWGGAQDPEEEVLQGLVVCVGEPVVEFVPSVRASTRQAPHLVFAAWRSMQWVAPDFARAPGATSCQVALALGRMGVPVAFLGAVGEDATGQQLCRSLEAEGVRTEGLLVSPRVRTSVSHLRLPTSFHSPAPAQLLADAAGLNPEAPNPGSERAASLQAQGVIAGLASAGEEEEEEEEEDGGHEPLLASLPIMLPLLHEATWVHCTALPFTCDGETGALVERCLDEALGALAPAPAQARGVPGAASGGGGHAKLFLDVNLPLLLWRSKAHAWASLAPIWARASVVEVSRAEAEFLIGEEPYVRRRDARCQYAAESHSQLRAMHDDYHYSRQEVAPLWERGAKEGGGPLELLLITDGTVLVHYYTRDFDGSVDGTEDLLVAALTCDRAGSGDAFVAGLIRKLVEEPGVLQSQDRLERAIRFAISAGVISQWTTGAVRSFPTAEATQSLTEQMFLSTLV